jgi:hypothetical protein
MPFTHSLLEKEKFVASTDSTFIDNLSLPIHRWYRYSAGFSSTWVKSLIEREKQRDRIRVFDPFAGSGTVLLEGEFCGVKAMGVESHPFVARIASTKLHWREDVESFVKHASSILEKAKNKKISKQEYPKLIERCFSLDNLSQLDALRKTLESEDDGSPISELTWLALVSIIRKCSHVGTSPWQYVLPNKTKAYTSTPFNAFKSQVLLMAEDMMIRQKFNHGQPAKLFEEDARECQSVPKGWADLVITSPPYANNYDYADATRLEMTFLGHIQGWGDLQEAVRKYLIRSCTQHVTKFKAETYNMTNDPLLKPIQDEITEVCEKLEKERVHHGGKKLYHTMIASYFFDMARVWKTLRRITSKGALVCFVIGDSAPYGIHVPVERWFGEIATSVGFKSYVFEKTRDRNIKWKNRKHRVPLHEGRLWVEG